LIGGLDRDYQGELIFEGHDRSTMTDKELSQLRNQEIGFVFQHFSLLDHLTVLDNVLLPSMLAPKEVKERVRAYLDQPVARALELLDRVGLSSKRDASPTTLSGGQKQRVAIARALFFNPPLLLCDEPTGSLDSQTGEQIITLFQDLNQAGYTVVMITHEERVSSAAQRVIVLEDGRLVTDRAPSSEYPRAEQSQGEIKQGETQND
jgi:putative ABC transport system ATP-binding protein